MHAPFNTTCTLYDGPGTATPGFPRVVDAPCRVVSDLFFQDIENPLDPSPAYLIIDQEEPNGPGTTDLGDDVWQFDYKLSDTVEIASVPNTTWQVLRVERCTWPGNTVPYWRATIVQLIPPEVPCVETYYDVYEIYDTNTAETAVVTRTSDLSWEEDKWRLDAGIGEPQPNCFTGWKAKNGDTLWTFESWNGQGTGIFIDQETGMGHIEVTGVEPE